MAKRHREVAPTSAVLNPPTVSTEMPPSFLFHLSWADEATRRNIMSRMREEHRQTMNLRLMPTAKLIHLTRQGDGETIGWGGVDCDHDPSHPEIFSLFVVPEYRTFTLGLLIEYVRYSYLRSRGFKTAYVRMEASSNFALLRYRVEKGLYVPAPKSTLTDPYVSLCMQCELFGRECTKQAYFEVDVENFLAHAEKRMGPFDLQSLPRDFELRKELIRKSARPIQEWVEEKSYKPYWL